MVMWYIIDIHRRDVSSYLYVHIRKLVALHLFTSKIDIVFEKRATMIIVLFVESI